MRLIEVVPYSEEWPVLFETDAAIIREILGDEVVEIHHIGSTSIPGLVAKPIIDILPVVKDIRRVDKYNQQFIDVGYEPRGEFGLPGRRYFAKGGENRTHHLHIYQVGNSEIDRHLAFRDYMITHPEEAEAYAELKQSLAKQFPYDTPAYCDGKDEFIKERERRALEWIKKR
ncbi:MAG: GrpB family protein [Candidatus Thorarchaeota archaeon]